MIVRDWRDADPADTQRLYAREQDFWVRELAWDASNAWREIEQARVTLGSSRPHCHRPQTRPFAAGATTCPTVRPCTSVASLPTTKDVTAAARRCVPESSRHGRPRPLASRASCRCAPKGSSRRSSNGALRCEHYHYLARPSRRPTRGRSTQAAGRTMWLIRRRHLLQAAYGDGGRHFAPRGLQTEWEHYVRGLVERPGCGVLEPAITRVIRRRQRDARARARHAHRARHDPPGAGRGAS